MAVDARGSRVRAVVRAITGQDVAPARGGDPRSAHRPDERLYSFANRKLANSRAQMNELLILGFDVYTQPVERTIDILRRRGIDMSKVSRATWENRPVFVVGADAGDSTSKQFWIDAERLLFVRLVETVKTPNGSRRDEYRFQRYVPHGQSWVAEEVTGLRDGKPSLREVYANVRVDVPIDDALFDPAQLATHTPWYKRNPAQ
ncbi:MAG: hypothetical protein DMD26_10005 [Gemmatimonadetes bacterium]|nr:MAG: hypothetical protein DMD26_10005 [Gemmatimonadota bacterium]